MLVFAGCALDEPRRLLLRGGEPVHLEPQAFDVLVHLARNADRVVPRVELLDEVWGDRFVSDSALGTRIKEIRRATGDDGDAQTVIRTVRGRGYQFVAVATEVASSAAATRLLGRDRDLREVLARSTPRSLVTVVGPGGVGKSSLARELAESWGDVAALVDLTVLGDALDLRAAIARAARLSDEEDPVSFLGARDLLLVLDDADDLVAEVATLCAELLRSPGARVRILVTCRERLGVEGEQVWPLLPLDEASSRELLLRRARELAPLAGVDGLATDELDRLTAAVDRLPLALEMLASTAAAVGVDSLDGVLGHGDVGLSRRDVPERHRSLHRLVSWSLDRLDADDATALVRLSAFAGSFTVQDAVAVIGDDAVVRLQSLTDRSLVAPVAVGGSVRRQLLRTVREAVRRRAGASGLEDAAAAHARLVADLLEDADRLLRGPREAEALPVFERLADEARAAHAWARAHDRPLAVELTRRLAQYSYTRMWHEPVEWARELAATGEAEPDVHLVLATAAGNLSRFDEARALAEPLLDVPGRVRLEALETLADVSIYSGDPARAAAYSRRLVDEASAPGLEHHRAIGYVDLVLATTYQGDFDAADAALAEPSLPADAVLSSSDRAWLLFARGETQQLRGDLRGLGLLRAAAELADSVDNPLLSAIAHTTQAETLVRRDVAAALPEFAIGLDHFVRRGNVTHLTGGLRMLVPVLDGLGEHAAAVLVSGWLQSPGTRPGYGDAVELVEQVVARARDRDGDEAVDELLARGAAAGAPEAAAIAAAAVARHLDDPAIPT